MALNSSLSVFRPLRSVIYVTKHTVLLKLYDLKIESFFLLFFFFVLFIAVSSLKNLSIKKKNILVCFYH